MFKRVFEQILPDLGEFEEDFRQYYLQGTVTLYSVTGFFVLIANLAMLRVDTAFYQSDSGLYTWMTGIRIAFSLVTIAFILITRNKPTPNRTDAMAVIWVLMTCVYFLLFQFFRPRDHLSTNIDILLVFGIYVLPVFRIRWQALLAGIFSISSVTLAFFYKTDVDPVTRNLLPLTHVFVHMLGLISAFQNQGNRRRVFLAYIHEKEAREMALDLLRTDSLTSCLARQYFLELVEKEMERAKRYSRPFSLIMMDIDRFKKINDKYGHHAGDEALKRFVQVVLAQKRQSDLLGRLGGEEFSLALPETDMEDAMKVARRICEVWAKTEIQVSALIVSSTVSIGATTMSETDAVFDDLLLRADKALYMAKQGGRNRVEFVIKSSPPE